MASKYPKPFGCSVSLFMVIKDSKDELYHTLQSWPNCTFSEMENATFVKASSYVPDNVTASHTTDGTLEVAP